jgi:DNA mismatch repair protein MutL
VYRAVADALGDAPAFRLAAAEAAAPPPPAQLTLPLPDPEAAPPSGTPVLHQELALLVPLGQWAARYVIAQGPAGLYLIDQHAAHERVYYDQLTAQAEAVPTVSQPLLLPLPISLSPAEWAAWETQRDALRAAGFVMEELGGTTLAVREVPRILGVDADLSLVAAVVQSLTGNDGLTGHPVSWILDQRLATAACKAAIKASRGLSSLEMRELLTALAQSPHPRTCPHGRPTLLVLGLEEVDRRFGR